MTAAETTADPSKLQRFHAGLLKFCKHPASILVWFCLLSLVVKEQYPFSHYPMYSGWSNRTHYFYIADENGPIQAKSVFKVSVPRTKKLYGGMIDDVKDEQEKNYDQLTDADFAEAGRRLLKQLRAGVPEKRLNSEMKDSERNLLLDSEGNPLTVRQVVNSNLTLVRVEVRRDGQQFSSTKNPVVTTSPDNQIVAP